MATKPDFLVTKEKMLVILATISVTILSPEQPGPGKSSCFLFSSYDVLVSIYLYHKNSSLLMINKLYKKSSINV